MAASLKQDEVEVELRSPDRRRKVAIVDKNGLTSMEIQEYLDVFEVLLDSKHLKCYCVCVCMWGGWLTNEFHFLRALTRTIVAASV